MPAGDADGTQRAYRLLLEVMTRTERAALGRFVMRTREYLALIRPRDERLTLTTLLFHDEVRPTKDVPTPTKSDQPSKSELDQAVAGDRGAVVPVGPVALRGRVPEAAEAILQRKRKGQTVKVPEAEEKEPQPVPDLMAALEESLASVKG